MASELILNFLDVNELTVRFDSEDSRPIAFQNPLTEAELGEVRWYLETYGVQYTADVDDDRASRLAVNLKRFGIRLFEAAFGERSGMRLFDRFLDEDEAGRLVTVQSVQPEILALPWELLHQPGGAYVFNERPRISVRRNLAGSRGGRAPKKFKPKEKLRVLMVVSRPSDAGFIDPRGESLAVLEAVKEQGRIEVEFLRPATLENLTRRLEDEDLPGVDILHFDGHGVFDPTGMLAGKSELLKGEGKNMGYLLFEKAKPEENKKTKKLEPFPTDLVSAEMLGELLNQQGLGLVVLSACQSSMYGVGEREKNEELAAIGSVAARLTQTGVQSVLAMSYSVLVKTTEMLFGSFYGELVRGKGIGESLDNARRSLMQNPERGGRSRGQDRIEMKLQDWFVPTLYQSGSDRGMVDPESLPAPNSGGAEPLEGMPEAPIAGFFGRRRELWHIERAFTPNLSDRRKETRRVTIAGFGGQGKTALAVEAGRWLVRSGMFDTAVFVDYQAFQGVDAVSVAVSTMARDLGMNLIDGDAATVELGRRRTLVILDNLEDLAGEVQQALLTQAIAWSETGQSRVLITTRQGDLGHGRYGRSGFEHQLIELKGLGSVADPEDAIDYFQGLMAVPPMPAMLPGRKALIELFGKVDFHPLSIALVAEQLRTRGIVDVIQALDRLLAEVPAGQSKDRSLIASLNLSLDRLDGDARSLVRRLGVFQGGAMESEVLNITELTVEQWHPIKLQLKTVGLIQVKTFPDFKVPYLKFHPTLAPHLLGELPQNEQVHLRQRYRKRYFGIAQYLYELDQIKPELASVMARQELSNLLAAVKEAIKAEEDWTVIFIEMVNQFLDYFSMDKDHQNLTQKAIKLSGHVGSTSWILAQTNLGEEQFYSGEINKAVRIFNEIVNELGDAASDSRGFILDRLGSCYREIGASNRAAEYYRAALLNYEQLGDGVGIKNQINLVEVHLANVLANMGEFVQARKLYATALEFAKKQRNTLRQASIIGGIGSLALHERHFDAAEECQKTAIKLCQLANTPSNEAMGWYELGVIYHRTQRFDQAEESYRKSAYLKEFTNCIYGSGGVVEVWNNLAITLHLAGKPKESEAWYRKALKASRKSDGNAAQISRLLNNLANLLQSQGKPYLSEAYQLAEEALAMRQALDPCGVEIWVTYYVLNQIATQQGEAAKAQEYRRLSRKSYAAFAGSRYALQKWEELIQGVVAAVGDSAVRQQWEEVSSGLGAMGYGNLVQAIQQILEGVRDEDELCDGLGYGEGSIVVEILSRL